MKKVSANVPVQILVIEDDPEIRLFLRTTLSAEGYRLSEATTAKEGLNCALDDCPGVILLDLGLPDFDGMKIIREVRSRNREVPIIVLSVRSQERDKVRALDAGANDFVNKPFAVGELLARLRVVLRRPATAPSIPAPVFRLGEVEVDLGKRRVLVGGNEVHLTRTEFRLLRILIEHADRVLTHSQLLSEVWGPDFADKKEYLHVYMGQLRRKIEADPARPRYLRMESGVGYRLKTE
jgi:two-component system KDP operon response regulator KdpE